MLQNAITAVAKCHTLPCDRATPRRRRTPLGASRLRDPAAAADRRPVRILVVNPTLGTGGAERLAVLIAGELTRRGHEVLMAYGTEDDEAALAARLGVRTLRLFD